MRKRSRSLSVNSIFGAPPLLEHEDKAAFDALHKRLTQDVKPRDIIERIWVWEVVVLTWDILRWHRVKTHLVKNNLAKSLTKFLEPHEEERWRTTDPDYIAAVEAGVDPSPILRRPRFEEEIVRGWVLKKTTAIALVDAVVPMDEVASDALVASIDKIEQIDNLIAQAENRRSNALLEIERHRHSFRRSMLNMIQDVEYKVIKSKSHKAAA